MKYCGGIMTSQVQIIYLTNQKQIVEISRKGNYGTCTTIFYNILHYFMFDILKPLETTIIGYMDVKNGYMRYTLNFHLFTHEKI